ncbi:MAG: helix-turn-helix domain-containing protein [Pseudomonadota bacterium]
MQLHVFPPHPKLAKLIMHISVFEWDESECYLPASLIPFLILFIRGGTRVEQPDGSFVDSPRFILRGPCNVPTHSFHTTGTLTISVGFRPGMLHQAMGILPADLLSSVLSMHEVCDHLRMNKLLLAMDEQLSINEYAQLFQDFLLDTLDYKKKAGMGAAFLAAHQKMFFPLIDLSLHFGIGERQLERRVREAFGVNLRDTRRIARFGFSLFHIIGHTVSWGDLTRIAHDSGYYDQAHMHREYLELAGISPAALLQKIASEDPAYCLYRLSQIDAKNLLLPTE